MRVIESPFSGTLIKGKRGGTSTKTIFFLSFPWLRLLFKKKKKKKMHPTHLFYDLSATSRKKTEHKRTHTEHVTKFWTQGLCCRLKRREKKMCPLGQSLRPFVCSLVPCKKIVTCWKNKYWFWLVRVRVTFFCFTCRSSHSDFEWRWMEQVAWAICGAVVKLNYVTVSIFSASLLLPPLRWRVSVEYRLHLD